MMLRKVDQLPLELNISQNPNGGGLYLPLDLVSSLGSLNLLTIPKFDTFDSFGDVYTLNVQNYVRDLITSRASSFPNGTVPWAPRVVDGQISPINIRVRGYNLTTGEPIQPQVLEQNLHIMDEVASLYHLNNGSLLLPYTKGFLETQEDVNEFIQEFGLDNSFLINTENGQPGNVVQYKQEFIESQGYWFINRGWSLTSGASAGTTTNEVFESKTSSSDITGGIEFKEGIWYISNLGKTGFRAIQFLDPQTMIPVYSGATATITGK
jgi:hypothetical protein